MRLTRGGAFSESDGDFSEEENYLPPSDSDGSDSTEARDEDHDGGDSTSVDTRKEIISWEFFFHG